MSDLIFILKCMVLTFVVAVLLQMKIGEVTVENHLFRLAGRSEIQDQLQLAAKGGSLLLKQTQEKAKSLGKEALALIRPVFDQNSNSTHE